MTFKKDRIDNTIYDDIVKNSEQPLKGIFRYLAIVISKPISKTNITANQITLLSFFICLISAPFFFTSNKIFLIIGAVLLNLGFLFDYVDGEIARIKNQSSKFGHWLDLTFDRILDCIVFLSIIFGVYYTTENIFVTLLGLTTLVLRFLIDFLRWTPKIVDYKVELLNQYIKNNLIKKQLIYSKSNLYFLVLVFSFTGRMDYFIYFWSFYTFSFILVFYFYLLKIFYDDPGYCD